MSPDLQPVFFVELALGWVLIFTRHSREDTLQIISARLSKNGPMVTFASDTSPHIYLVKGLARNEWRQCVLVFPRDFGLRGGNCIGLLSNTCFSLPRLLIQVSHAWRQSFANGVSDLCSSSLKFQHLIVRNRYLLVNFHVVQFQYVFELLRLTYLNLYRISKTSSDGIFIIDNIIIEKTCRE